MKLDAITDAQGKAEKPMKIYQIFLDGIDKTGKDLIRSYIFYLGKGRYICVARGIMSMRVYSKLYDRPYQYEDENQQYALNVMLTVEKEDWKIRCKATNEALTNYEKEQRLFTSEYMQLKSKGYYVKKYNTSKITPYEIAKDIISYMEKINGSNN